MATDVLAPLVEEVRGIKDASESIHTIVVRLADLIESGGADPAEIQALAEQLRGSAAVLADAALIGTAAGGGDPVPDPEPTPEPEPEPEPTPEP